MKEPAAGIVQVAAARLIEIGIDEAGMLCRRRPAARGAERLRPAGTCRHQARHADCICAAASVRSLARYSVAETLESDAL